MKFYLGTHQACWLKRTTIPLCVSYGRLRVYKRPPRALCSWILDSRGFTEIFQHGRWTIPAKVYADDATRYLFEIGCMQKASIQDWMCEPKMIAKTGLNVLEHQKRTIHSYFELIHLAPDVPWIPVLQGYLPSDYMRHIEMYKDAGLNLVELPLVGLGSVCGRQNTKEIHDLIFLLASQGLKMHGFGLKLSALTAVSNLLASADSMAWSRGARESKPLHGCHHGVDGQGKCTSCMRYALRWRKRVLDATTAKGQRFLSVCEEMAA